MGRAIAGVIVGYIAMFAAVFIMFTGAYLALGADRSFKPGTYDVSLLFIAVAVVVSLIGAIVGGLVCALIAGRRKPAYVLAGLVLVLGLALSYPVLTQSQPDPGPRAGDVKNLEAMMKAKTPVWEAVLNPVIGLVGTILGARLKKEAPKAA